MRQEGGFGPGPAPRLIIIVLSSTSNETHVVSLKVHEHPNDMILFGTVSSSWFAHYVKLPQYRLLHHIERADMMADCLPICGALGVGFLATLAP